MTVRTATARSPWMSRRKWLATVRPLSDRGDATKARSPSENGARGCGILRRTRPTRGARMTSHRIAVIGGTGPQGKALGYRFARHGHAVVLGSRAAEKGQAAAAEVAERLRGVAGAGEVRGATNAHACGDADVVLLAVPYDGHAELVASLPLAGKTVISCVSQLGYHKRGAYGVAIDAGEGSAAESAQRLPPAAVFVVAFHHDSAVTLWGE